MALTKKDRENLLSDFKAVFATKDDLQEVKAELKEVKAELKEFKNDTLNGQDKILKQLSDLRTDKLMLISRNREHEERIVRLEQKVLV
ncbi:hypothetical protein A2276_01750 [candidate division WOR-1 bacterium RIFOXYA12_FULL_43_27]|uniref:Uncharacterized protein n=1 Tax=candidate division WOR-1 bacterium RIFOXYC2_FULL_46_14 TaxID=1802587 RepID=A0A1F4U6M6_UNCSA|nr:MAG: hypothetical protein A2276_01750 [candidate division WOR-1 bacterium RIFOXYA12_FULL_43_27]OGC19551.1 MAG: hypothetical protein A2292_02580 [candidate division WOR-1 bacterium RIFOXYB2_FULL_46_45]OGC30539.1 MAG: hypothetical protein A2232_02580 [candidate division WOR-1 bacterium RIFOXYA2_FULL_46_56]OGC40606.1 MAG: hypothetical protein A2438_06295 [candidate division WOR-1 bacterium RIFOXYC2_FULL_46_14]